MRKDVAKPLAVSEDLNFHLTELQAATFFFLFLHFNIISNFVTRVGRYPVVFKYIS